MECTEHYCNSGSLVCGHLLNEGTRGSQIFVVPRSGNYTVTIAGASGGHGLCSNYSGLGVIARETVQFRRGEILRILVGQQGISACDGYQDVDICQISSDQEACETLWNTIYEDLVFFKTKLYDGGGGGGGASLLEYKGISLNNGNPIVIAPGGGGAAAIYNETAVLSLLNIAHNDTDDPEMFYRDFTYGHAFEISSGSKTGTIGEHIFVNAPGPGAGYYQEEVKDDTPAVVDAQALSLTGFGGLDCVEVVRLDPDPPFLGTDGGFGGGGGACEGGGWGRRLYWWINFVYWS